MLDFNELEFLFVKTLFLYSVSKLWGVDVLML